MYIKNTPEFIAKHQNKKKLPVVNGSQTASNSGPASTILWHILHAPSLES